MPEEELENIIRAEVSCLEKKDIESYLKYFTDDVIFVTSQGIFKGKDEFKRFIIWLLKDLEETRFLDDGIGIITKDNRAVYQYVIDAKYKGIKAKVSCIGTYEFEGNKIKNHWTVMDRLSLAKQVAKGPIAKKIISTVVAKTDQGL